MASRVPFQATVLRQPSPDAICTCSHWIDCDCGCHDRRCDPAEEVCHVDYLPDEGGKTHWGCPGCTPGEDAPHYLGCELIGWNVSFSARRQASGVHLHRFA